MSALSYIVNSLDDLPYTKKEHRGKNVIVLSFNQGKSRAFRKIRMNEGAPFYVEIRRVK